MTWRTFFLALQWQHTVHRYLRVLHSRIMKRPPKKVTMEEARKAHHIRWPLLSQGTSGEKGMMTFILEIWIEGSWLNFSLLDIMGHWSPASPPTIHSTGIQALFGAPASAHCPSGSAMLSQPPSAPLPFHLPSPSKAVKVESIDTRTVIKTSFEIRISDVRLTMRVHSWNCGLIRA